MKKQLLAFLLLTIFVNFSIAQEAKTIHVETPGTLNSLIPIEEMNRITNLTVTGNIDVRDMVYIEHTSRPDVHPTMMPVDLDFSNANIHEYTGADGTYHHFDADKEAVYTYPANELPAYIYSNFSTMSGMSPYRTIKLPKTLISVGEYALTGCDGLQALYSYTEHPIIIKEQAFGVGANVGGCYLYIPKGTTANYENSEMAEHFKGLIEMTTNQVPQDKYDSSITVTTKNSNIVIDNVTQGEVVQLFSIEGKLLKSITSNGESLYIPVDKNAVYLIRIGNKTHKIVI